jgi:Polyketide cyclase / dehydrase and lipid transport
VARLTLAAAGRASAGEAWERYAQVAAWSRWSPQIRSVTCSSSRIRTGATGHVRGPLGVGVDFVVDAVDEESRQWVWTVGRGPVVLQLHHRVVPVGEGARTTLTMSGPLPVLLGYAPLARLALGRLVRPGR